MLPFSSENLEQREGSGHTETALPDRALSIYSAAVVWFGGLQQTQGCLCSTWPKPQRFCRLRFSGSALWRSYSKKHHPGELQIRNLGSFWGYQTDSFSPTATTPLYMGALGHGGTFAILSIPKQQQRVWLAFGGAGNHKALAFPFPTSPYPEGSWRVKDGKDAEWCRWGFFWDWGLTWKLRIFPFKKASVFIPRETQCSQGTIISPLIPHMQHWWTWLDIPLQQWCWEVPVESSSTQRSHWCLFSQSLGQTNWHS